MEAATTTAPIAAAGPAKSGLPPGPKLPAQLQTAIWSRWSRKGPIRANRAWLMSGKKIQKFARLESWCYEGDMTLAHVHPHPVRTRRPSSRRRLTVQEVDLALSSYRRTLAKNEAQGNWAGMATCCLQMGDLYMLLDDGEQAEELYRLALVLSRSVERPAVQRPM